MLFVDVAFRHVMHSDRVIVVPRVVVDEKLVVALPVTGVGLVGPLVVFADDEMETVFVLLTEFSFSDSVELSSSVVLSISVVLSSSSVVLSSSDVEISSSVVGISSSGVGSSSDVEPFSGLNVVVVPFKLAGIKNLNKHQIST